MNLFHKFFNPHCPECRDEKLDGLICDSCNTLRQENVNLRKHNDQLIQALLDKVNPKKDQIPQQVVITQPVSNNLSWRARRHMLETEDKKSADLLKEKRKEMATPIKSVTELESELEIENASKVS